MNIMAKLKSMQREIEALRAENKELNMRLDDIGAAKFSTLPDGRRIFMSTQDVPTLHAAHLRDVAARARQPAILGTYSAEAMASAVVTFPDEPLTTPIEVAKPIASATIAAPPKKRGRPPKA